MKQIPSPLKMKRKVLIPIESRSIQEAIDLFVLQNDEKIEGLKQIMVDSTNNRALLIYEDHAITMDNEGKMKSFMQPISFQPLPSEKSPQQRLFEHRQALIKKRVLKTLNRKSNNEIICLIPTPKRKENI